MNTEKCNVDQTDMDGFIRLPEILKLLPISKSSWWLGVKNGKYPKSVKLSERTTAWKNKDIKDLLDSFEN